VKKVSDNVVRHSLAYLSSIHAKMVRWGRAKLAESDRPPSQSPIFNQYFQS